MFDCEIFSIRYNHCKLRNENAPNFEVWTVGLYEVRYIYPCVSLLGTPKIFHVLGVFLFAF